MDKKPFRTSKNSGNDQKKRTIKNAGFIALLVLIGLIIFGSYGNKSEKLQEIGLSQVIQQANNGEYEKIVVTGAAMEITKDNEDKPSLKSRVNSNVSLREEGVDYSKVNVEYKEESKSGSIWGSLLLTLLPVVLIIGVLVFMMRSAQGQGNQAMSFGKSRARLYGNEKGKISFKDIAGYQESKQDLEEVVEFLKFPKKFESVGAKIPKGVLLVGPPGTGKTMIARAVAGEADVPFFSISGSEFVEMFVGVGASRVRDLFAKAKKNAPCIIFIDEIDAVGRRRGSGMGGGHDEREQTLNQILTEMDGFEQGANVIVVAATNRVDVLDPALLRPGRFDRRVTVGLPDRKEREAILKKHFEKKPAAKKAAPKKK